MKLVMRELLATLLLVRPVQPQPGQRSTTNLLHYKGYPQSAHLSLWRA
jgi:hypothetical protein